MQAHELINLSQETLDLIINNACDDAPWKTLPGDAMSFLRKGVKAGLPWKIHPDVLTAYTHPKRKTGVKQQEQARQSVQWFLDPLVKQSGIILFAEHEAGRWERDDEGNYVNFTPDRNLVGKEQLMATAMEMFWPDIPPPAWARLSETLVVRKFEEQQSFFGEKHAKAEDYLDFGKLYRALLHVNKLEPHDVIDWDKIVNPSPQIPTSGKKRKSTP